MKILRALAVREIADVFVGEGQDWQESQDQVEAVSLHGRLISSVKLSNTIA